MKAPKRALVTAWIACFVAIAVSVPLRAQDALGVIQLAGTLKKVKDAKP
jgi:hypothetical protein